MALDDEGDFKKARGFLLTYSSLVLAMWFFQAKLTKFNLMGVSLTLEHHKESIWLVLALLNAYFWFRCWQRMPRHGLYFDAPMHELYDDALVWFAVKLKRRALKRCVKEQFALKHDPSEQMRVVRYRAVAIGRASLEELERQYGDVGGLHQIGREERTKMHLCAEYKYTSRGEWVPFAATANYGEYLPSAAMTWTVKAFLIAKGAFVTPWFTDHVAPLVLGGISTAIALWKWCEVNFFTVVV